MTTVQTTNPKLASLALYGGTKTKTTPYGHGGPGRKRFDETELGFLKQAIEQNTLFYAFGKLTAQACDFMKQYIGVPYVVPCCGGTAAVHLGLIAAGIGPGDEVITTPNTDSGTIIGIIEEGAVPIFCDPEYTLQPSVAAIAAKVTSRTKAVIVVHLAGYPAPVDEIVAFCNSRGIAVVEDCAQAWGAKLNGKMVGSFGIAGAFSTNDYKHISTGDGGFVTLHDAELHRRVYNYSDKCYDRLHKLERFRDHHAMQYRMTELQGAVALGQFKKLDWITGRHHELGTLLRSQMQNLPNAKLVDPLPGAYCTYWWIPLLLQPDGFIADSDKITEALRAEGLGPWSSQTKYDLIQSKLLQTRVARPWLNDDRKYYPFKQPDGREYYYRSEDLPRHTQMMKYGLRFTVYPHYTIQDIEETARGTRKVLEAFAK